MIKRVFRLASALVLFPVLAGAQTEDDARIRDAAARGVAAIQKAQSGWYTTHKQVCASCHHQY